MDRKVARRAISVGMVVIMIALSMAACGYSQATRPSSSRFRLALVGRGNIPRAYIDGSRKGSSPGDSYVYRGSLANQSDERVGRLRARLDTFRSRPGWGNYEATFSLWGRGTLVALGARQVESDDRNHGTLAVVGGTGEFIAAEGTVHVWVLNKGLTSFRFRLR